VLVGHNNAGDIIYRRFDCAEPTQILLAGFLDKTSWAKWVSARNIDRPGYVYIGNTEFNEAPAKNPFDDNVIAVRIANGEIERWCRGQGSGADSGSFERYWVPSADGKRLYITLPAVFRTNNPPRDTAQETYLCQYMPSGT
jgi:hypothetical protein